MHMNNTLDSNWATENAVYVTFIVTIALIIIVFISCSISLYYVNYQSKYRYTPPLEEY